MSSTTLYRFSGVALLIGGVLAIIGQLLLTTADPGTPLWIPGSWLTLAGTLLVILGLPGLYFKQVDRAGHQLADQEPPRGSMEQHAGHRDCRPRHERLSAGQRRIETGTRIRIARQRHFHREKEIKWRRRL